MNFLLRFTSIALLMSFPVLAANGALAQDTDGSDTPLEEIDAVPEEVIVFDAQPLLNAMIALRGAALTCEPFVNNSPDQRTQGVVGYFQALGQTLPDLTNRETQASLRRFIGSQAAMLCQDKLNRAFAAYDQRAALYEANRPQEWPAAPAANPAPWCGLDYCLDR